MGGSSSKGRKALDALESRMKVVEDRDKEREETTNDRLSKLEAEQSRQYTELKAEQSRHAAITHNLQVVNADRLRELNKLGSEAAYNQKQAQNMFSSRK